MIGAVALTIFGITFFLFIIGFFQQNEEKEQEQQPDLLESKPLSPKEVEINNLFETIKNNIYCITDEHIMPVAKKMDSAFRISGGNPIEAFWMLEKEGVDTGIAQRWISLRNIVDRNLEKQKDIEKKLTYAIAYFTLLKDEDNLDYYKSNDGKVMGNYFEIERLAERLIMLNGRLFAFENEKIFLKKLLYPAVLTHYKPSSNSKNLNTNQNEYRNNQEKVLVTWKDNQVHSLLNIKDVYGLLDEKETYNVKYKDLLRCFEWQAKRLSILLRDHFTCQKCGRISHFNHVHHKYYIKDTLPWDINNEALITLCGSCHSETHKEESIPIMAKNHGRLEIYKGKLSCPKCGGGGYIGMYRHIERGICFLCYGNKEETGVFFSALEKVKKRPARNKEEQISYLNDLNVDDFYKCVPLTIRSTNLFTDLSNLH